jgi:hypothetical protein
MSPCNTLKLGLLIYSALFTYVFVFLQPITNSQIKLAHLLKFPVEMDLFIEFLDPVQSLLWKSNKKLPSAVITSPFHAKINPIKILNRIAAKGLCYFYQLFYFCLSEYVGVSGILIAALGWLSGNLLSTTKPQQTLTRGFQPVQYRWQSY